MIDKRKLLKVVIALVLLISAGFVVFNVFGKEIDYKIFLNYFEYNVKNFINSFGKFGWIIFILVFTLRTLFIVLPYSLMTIIGGGLFGYKIGFILSMISVFLSASLAYFLSKKLGAGFMGKFLKGRLGKVDIKAGEHGFKVVFLMRISLVFPYDISNYAVGLTSIKYRDFILGTMLGILPETLSFSLLGSNINKPSSTSLLISLGLVFITIVVPILYNKFKKKEVSDSKAGEA